MKHIRLFENTQQAATVLAKLQYPTLSAIRGESGIALKPGVPPGPETTPFYIDVRGTVTLSVTSGLQMSTDGTNWTDTVAGSLPVGKTYFRVASDQASPLKPDWTENTNSDYDIGGNINSLVKTDFANHTNCYSFNQYFKDKTKLKSAGNLILPATTLVESCYNRMFMNCTSLTTVPVLYATTLAEQCYSGMFVGCTALITTPALPATTLVDSCYSSMFSGCTALTTAPVLLANTLAISCYSRMFFGCTALTTAPELPATTLANYCYSSMFSGCTALTTAPDLLATTLNEWCYSEMFQGCTQLNYIKCLATNISASKCTMNWLYNVSSNGTFVKDASMPVVGYVGAGWKTGSDGVPSGWTVRDV